jgi:hypothetical protein
VKLELSSGGERSDSSDTTVAESSDSSRTPERSRRGRDGKKKQETRRKGDKQPLLDEEKEENVGFGKKKSMAKVRKFPETPLQPPSGSFDGLDKLRKKATFSQRAAESAAGGKKKKKKPSSKQRDVFIKDFKLLLDDEGAMKDHVPKLFAGCTPFLVMTAVCCVVTVLAPIALLVSAFEADTLRGFDTLAGGALAIVGFFLIALGCAHCCCASVFKVVYRADKAKEEEDRPVGTFPAFDRVPVLRNPPNRLFVSPAEAKASKKGSKQKKKSKVRPFLPGLFFSRLWN